jgi:hypothetical protein
MPHEIYIAHAAADARVAVRLAAALEARNWHCWLAARDLPRAGRAGGAIECAVREARVLVAIVSADAHASADVESELDWAASRGVPLLAVRLDASRAPRRTAGRLAKAPSYDARSGAFERHLEALVVFVAAALTKTPRAGDTISIAAPPAPRVLRPLRVALTTAAAIALIASGVAFTRLLDRQERGPALEAAPRLSAQMRPAVERAAATVVETLETVADRVELLAAALDARRFGPRAGRSAADLADLEATVDGPAAHGAARAQLAGVRAALTEIAVPLAATRGGLEPLLQRGADVGVLMKFRARVDDVSEPVLLQRTLDAARRRLEAAIASEGETFEEELARAAERISVAVELVRHHGRLAFAAGLRLLDPAREQWPADACERLARLAVLGSSGYDSIDAVILAQAAMETEAARLEEEIARELDGATRDDERVAGAAATETAGATAAAEASGDVSWQSVIREALAARAAGDSVRSAAALRRYVELCGPKDPLAQRYADTAQALTAAAPALRLKGGLFLARVEPSSVAYGAGLRTGDVLIVFDDTDVSSFADLRRVVESSTARRDVPVELLRRDPAGAFQRHTLILKDDFRGVEMIPG